MKFPLDYIIFEITQECNLSCGYCYNHWRRSDLTPQKPGFTQLSRTLKKVIASIDFKHITFTGGEPFLAEGLKELILACRMKGKSVNLITNGTCPTEGDLMLLAQMGVSIFELPLLSDTPELHDRLTGVPGSFNKVIRTLSCLLQLRAELCVVFVMTKVNITRLPATLVLAEKLGIPRFMLARFNIGGRGIANCEELLPTLNDLRSAFSFAADFAANHRMSISANVCLPRCIIDRTDYPGILVSSCSGDFRRRPVTIDFAGDVRMCNHSPVVMGNIFHGSVEAIFTSEYAASWETSRPAYCIDCAKWKACRGGCRAAAEQLGQTLDHEDPVVGLLLQDRTAA